MKCLDQFSHTNYSNYDLILASLLPALLKLEKLVLDAKIGYDTYYFDGMMYCAARRESPFDIQPPSGSLKVFDFSHTIQSGRSPHFMASISMLPAIQEIRGGFRSTWEGENDHNDSYSRESLRAIDSSSSTLSTLDLTAYNLSPAELDHRLRAPKGPRTLSYKSEKSYLISFSGIRDNLKPLENFLENLRFDCLKYDFLKTDNLLPIASFTSLNTLKCSRPRRFF